MPLLVDGLMLEEFQDVLILLLEIFVGLASFTACLVAVDKLYLFYACVFYKVMAFVSPNAWEPTLRYPRRFKRNAKKAIEKDFFKQCEMACPIYQEKERSRAVLEATLGPVIAGKKGKAPTEDELRRVVQIKDACASFLAAHGLGGRAP